MTTIIGIKCHVVWLNEDPEYFYVSFGTYDYETDMKHDSYGIPDDEVFYYFTDHEQQRLLKAIAQHEAEFQVDDSWYIDLVMGYELVERDF
jgi:hypothetical protein